MNVAEAWIDARVQLRAARARLREAERLPLWARRIPVLQDEVRRLEAREREMLARIESGSRDSYDYDCDPAFRIVRFDGPPPSQEPT